MLYIQDLNSRFTLREQLGKGTYGQVSRAHDTLTNTDVAVKTFDGVESFVQELSLYTALDHPNIAKLIAWSFDRTTLSSWYLVLPLGIPSRDAIEQKMITLDHAIHDLMSGISFLHHHGIYHGDIKDWNIIYIQGRMVFVDFGNTVRATPYNGKWYVRYVLSTPGYVDPEFYPYDWNPIESELYAIAGVIWDYYVITRGRSHTIAANFNPYEIFTSDVNLNNLLLALISYPIKDRKTAEEIWNEWDGQKSMGLPLSPGKYLQSSSPQCRPEDNDTIHEYLKANGGYKNQLPPSARAFFAGSTLYRTVSTQLSNIGSSAGHVSRLYHLDDCITIAGCIFSDYDVCAYVGIEDILIACDGMCIMKNLWDTAGSAQDLETSVHAMITCSGVETHHIAVTYITDKNVYLSAIWTPLYEFYPFDSILQFNNLAAFSREIKDHLVDDNPAYFFFLHFAKFLPELSNKEAITIFDKMNENDFRRQLLNKIVGFAVDPTWRFNGYNVQPFQLDEEDFLPLF